MAFSKPVYQHQRAVAGWTIPRAMKWVPSLGLWGVAAVGAGTLFLSPIPLFQKDVLHKIPVVADYFIDKTPDSDKPF